jgi:hypothetical protein
MQICNIKVNSVKYFSVKINGCETKSHTNLKLSDSVLHYNYSGHKYHLTRAQNCISLVRNRGKGKGSSIPPRTHTLT